MEGKHILLVVLLGVASCSHDWISGSVLEATVRPGDNITLYCDCKVSTGVSIVWYRNCSHENQPALVLEVKFGSLGKTLDEKCVLNLLPRFCFVRNFSSESYDLLIKNIKDSDEGLYYCGTEQNKVEEKEYITTKSVYTYGNITTRIIFNYSSDSSGCIANPVLGSWMMVFTPAFTILSSFLSFVLVYHFCQKTDKEAEMIQKRPDTRGQTRRDQDEDVCFTRVVFWAGQDGQTHQ